MIIFHLISFFIVDFYVVEPGMDGEDKKKQKKNKKKNDIIHFFIYRLSIITELHLLSAK